MSDSGEIYTSDEEEQISTNSAVKTQLSDNISGSADEEDDVTVEDTDSGDDSNVLNQRKSKATRSLSNYNINDSADEDGDDVSDSAGDDDSNAINRRKSKAMQSHSNNNISSGADENDDDASHSSDESIVFHRRKSKTKKRAFLDESDSDEAEMEMEQRAFSPRTRMSITGIRPEDLTDESSEIDYSDTEVVSGKPKKSTMSVVSEENENNLTSEQSLSIVETDDENKFEESTKMHTIIEASDVGSTIESSSIQSDDIVATVEKSPRYTTHFATDIGDKLSSTLFMTPRSRKSIPESDDSDVVVLSNKENPIEILSSDDDDEQIKNKENRLNQENVLSNNNLKQPKITTAIKQSQINLKTQEFKYVSKDFYIKELRKLDDLKIEYTSAEKLLDKVAGSLPDGGQQLKSRIERLKNDLAIKGKYIASLKVEDGSQLESKPKPKAVVDTNVPSWDDLSDAVGQVQPKHTGTKGMAKFTAEKALTVDRLKDLHGSLKNCPAENVLADDPKGLKVSLMDHQKHALAWMTWREMQKPRGGILADDMGLGKTLTMISMILASKNRDEEEKDEDAKESSESETEDDAKTTWTSKGRRDYYNGGTLVICPASLMRQWENEVETKLNRHKLTVCVHHGPNRDTKPKHLRTYDIVVTTYHIVTNEYKTTGALFGMKWRRIILDEAHVIRNHKAQSSLSVCGLRGKYRWVLTGTPIQNKEMDVYALLKFLRCSPFDELAHWKKWIDNKSAGGQQRLNMLMKSLMLRRTKVQLIGTGKLENMPSKEIKLIEVTLDKDEMNVYQMIMTYSRSLFAQFLFQRAERNTDLMFREDAKQPTFMQSKNPNGAYYKVHQKFSQLHHGAKEVKSHEILTLLLRLRQICCHPGLIDAMLESDETQQMESDSDQEQPEIDLLAQLNKLAIDDHSTSLHDSMLNNSIEAEHPEKNKISKASARLLQRSNPVFDLKRPSSKMVKVLNTAKNLVLNTSDKAIIVSQWTSVLAILKQHLHNDGVQTLSLDGTIPVKNRQSIVNEFNDSRNSKRILLLSLTAGGVGLNLVGANHLLLIDLHWNPQLEAQAQDRIYRVGQKKSVTIYKFMCLDTVEQRIKALQDRKLEMADGVLTGVKTTGAKLTMEDLKGLFGI